MAEKKKRKNKKLSIEELYQNKNFVPPKEKNLETIFEEPRKAKNGTDVLTSVRKYKRYLHFDPTQGKIHKRKLMAKKCKGKMKTGKLKTRSTAKKKECEDISLYILQAIGDLSDSEMEQAGDDDAKDNSTISASKDPVVHDTPQPNANIDMDSQSLGTAAKEDSQSLGTAAKEDSQSLGTAAKKDSQSSGTAAKEDSQSLGTAAKEDSQSLGTAAKEDSQSLGTAAKGPNETEVCGNESLPESSSDSVPEETGSNDSTARSSCIVA